MYLKAVLASRARNLCRPSSSRRPFQYTLAGRGFSPAAAWLGHAASGRKAVSRKNSFLPRSWVGRSKISRRSSLGIEGDFKRAVIFMTRLGLKMFMILLLVACVAAGQEPVPPTAQVNPPQRQRRIPTPQPQIDNPYYPDPPPAEGSVEPNSQPLAPAASPAAQPPPAAPQPPADQLPPPTTPQ